VTDTRKEVAARARRLIATSGRSVANNVTSSVIHREYRLGCYYMRVRLDRELIIDDVMGTWHVTVFSQRDLDTTGAWHDYDHEHELLTALRQAMILDDLASI